MTLTPQAQVPAPHTEREETFKAMPAPLPHSPPATEETGAVPPGMVPDSPGLVTRRQGPPGAGPLLLPTVKFGGGLCILSRLQQSPLLPRHPRAGKLTMHAF